MHAAGEDPLRRPVHDVGMAAEEATLRERRASPDAAAAAPFYRADCLISAYAFRCAHLAAEEDLEGAVLRQRRESQDSAGPPFYRADCLISAYASRFSTTPTPAPRDHEEASPRCLAADEERAGGRAWREAPFYRADCLISAYAYRRAATAAPALQNQDGACPRCRAHLAAGEERAGPFYRGGVRRMAVPSWPTSPASPQRPRRRRGTTVRRGCGSARASPPSGSASPHKPSGSPLPGGEDSKRSNCCVRLQLYGDASRRCVRAAAAAAAGCVGSGVKDLAGAPLQRSLSAESDSSTSNSEDPEDLTLDDSSMVVLIGTPSRPASPASPRRPRRRRGTTARRGCGSARTSPHKSTGSPLPGGIKDLAGTPLQCAGEASTSSGEEDSPVPVLIGKQADGGTAIKAAAADVFLGSADREEWMPRFDLAVELGPLYWLQELIDWLKGSSGDRSRDFWSWRGVVGKPIKQQHAGTCAICSTLVCLEARHRLDFERRHGFNTFPYRISAQAVADLKILCEERGVWTAKHGVRDHQELLELIRETGGVAVAGVPGWKPCRLQLKTWKSHQSSDRKPMSLSNLGKLIRMEGPILGGLTVDDLYFLPVCEQGVYPGVRRGYKGKTQHSVVCTAYCPQSARERHWPDRKVLVIEVVDNQRSDGPVRCIRASAFFVFLEIHVEPLDATELRVKKPSLWRRLLDTVSPQHRL